MPAKRRLLTSGLQFNGTAKKARGDHLAQLAPGVLFAAVRPWGKAFPFFEGLETDVPLWQVQIVGSAKDAFGPGKALKFSREALLEHPDKDVRCLESLEKVLRVKLNIGAPPAQGVIDPDDVGVVPWNVAVYCAGADPSPALDFVTFVLDHKKRVGELAVVPRLGLLTTPRGFDFGKDFSRWVRMDFPLPKPFAVGPPKGRRHVVCQLELARAEAAGGGEEQPEEEDDEEKPSQGSGRAENPAGGRRYSLLFYGGIYAYRGRFDEKDVPGAHAPSPSGRDRDYVRALEVEDSSEGKLTIQEIFADVLLGVPLHFVNAASAEDPLAKWVAEQESVLATEMAETE
ncbi:unnamed protein product [Effrenium voratum]|nr:unnamed protein product [Effrenium voratum]CAJ1456999.1 unnamed protein product [Effrenium voratum]CAJ1459737.1 unnamed protein product [Effrenium voratum]